MDIRYALRGIRRSPLFAVSVSATIGLGLGVLCSAFAILNTYLLKPVDLPEPYSLYGLDWDTATTRRQPFTLQDFESLRESGLPFTDLAASRSVLVMHDNAPMTGLLVTGNFFPLLRGRMVAGRPLVAADAAAPGAQAVVVLSHQAWRSRFGADPAIVGKAITLGRQRFDVVGVTPPYAGLPGQEIVAFWAPLTMAAGFGVPEPWTAGASPSLTVVGRLRHGATADQARASFEAWLDRRFPAGSEFASVLARVESRATRAPLGPTLLGLVTLILFAFGLVLLVACANVTNLVLARGFLRQREIAVRLSLGATRRRVVRQLLVEALVLAVPSAAVGLGLMLATVRAFPVLIIATFPTGFVPLDLILQPIEADFRVIAFLVAAAIASTVAVSLAPALRVTRADLVKASKGEVALDVQRSRLRTGLVALQIGACVVFLVGAAGLVQQSRTVANADPGLEYDGVATIRIAQRLRAPLTARLARDPEVEQVARVAWRPPLSGTLRSMDVVASGSRIEGVAGFMEVSPGYFPLFGIRVHRGRTFTPLEADERAPVVLVSAATAQRLWPGLDPIGQTLDVVPRRRSEPPPPHRNVRVIGVTENVTSTLLGEPPDATLVYFATGVGEDGLKSILLRGRTTPAALRGSVTAAIRELEPDAAFEFTLLNDVQAGFRWILGAFSTTASVLGVLGLVLAFSGTYAVVAFLVAQRTREFGIRMALGATVRDVVAVILHDTMRTAAAGLIVGAAAAFAIFRLFAATVPIIPVIGPGPFAAAVAVVLAATVTAALLPSIRTARIDPSRALRVE